jgi:hypothetical protein
LVQFLIFQKPAQSQQSPIGRKLYLHFVMHGDRDAVRAATVELRIFEIKLDNLNNIMDRGAKVLFS